MWTTNFYNFRDYWELRHKVTFDGVQKLILVNYGITSLDVNTDIYSDWKEWSLIYDYLKFPPAISAIGGESLGAGQFVGSTYFLENGWRIRPWEGDHSLTIDGNLYTREAGDSPTVPTLGKWSVGTTYVRSAIVFKVETATTQTSSVPTAAQIAQAVWDLALTSSIQPNTFGSQVGTQLLTFAQHLATK